MFTEPVAGGKVIDIDEIGEGVNLYPCRQKAFPCPACADNVQIACTQKHKLYHCIKKNANKYGISFKKTVELGLPKKGETSCWCPLQCTSVSLIHFDVQPTAVGRHVYVLYCLIAHRNELGM